MRGRVVAERGVGAEDAFLGIEAKFAADAPADVEVGLHDADLTERHGARAADAVLLLSVSHVDAGWAEPEDVAPDVALHGRRLLNLDERGTRDLAWHLAGNWALLHRVGRALHSVARICAIDVDRSDALSGSWSKVCRPWRHYWDRRARRRPGSGPCGTAPGGSMTWGVATGCIMPGCIIIGCAPAGPSLAGQAPGRIALAARRYGRRASMRLENSAWMLSDE